MAENEALEILNNESEDVSKVQVALKVARNALEEIQQYRVYKEIFESHFSKESLKLLSDKEEFGKWLKRSKWITIRCDEIARELEQYRAIGTIEEFKALKEDKIFLEFLYNQILPNEMEQYLSMYHAKDKVAVNGYADQCGLMSAT